MLVRHGAVIAEGWWQPYSADQPHLLYSLSKSFTSTALGIAVAEGLVDLDAPVLAYFPELDGEVTDPGCRSILVRHVAAMASGHREDTLERAKAIDPDNLLRGLLLIPPEAPPGSVFAYNQPCTFAVGAIVQRVSGQSLTEYLRPRLFDPLGIGEVAWQRDAAGREIGWSGLFAPTEAVAKLGLLYLQQGLWEGRPLLARDWVQAATRRHVDTPADRDPDWRLGYGFQFWISRSGYRGDGAYGQFCLVLPEFDAVLALTAQTEELQEVLDLVWKHLLPALRSGDLLGTSTSTSRPVVNADAELADRLRTLRLPPAAGRPLPTATAEQRFRAEPGNDQPGLTEVFLEHRTDQGWLVVLSESDSRIEGTLGIGRWATTGVVAISGGWSTADDASSVAGSIAVDVLFLHTPHRLRLVCRPDTGTFASRWVTAPLQSPALAQLRMPKE